MGTKLLSFKRETLVRLLPPGGTRQASPDFWALQAAWCRVGSPGLGVDLALVQVPARNLYVPDQVTSLSQPASSSATR